MNLKSKGILLVALVTMIFLSVIIFPTHAQTLCGYALSFDGSNDYVEVGDSSSLNITGGTLSWELWVKPDSFNGDYFISKGDNPSRIQYIYIGADGKIEFRVGTANGASYATSDTPLVVGNWYHLVMVYDSEEANECVLYINGTLDKSTSLGGGNIVTTSGNPLFLGQYPLGQYRYDGTIDEVYIYNRALTSSEVASAYVGSHSTNGLVLMLKMNEGTGSTVTDTSGQGNDGTIYGATWVNSLVPPFQVRVGATQIITTVTWIGSNTTTITLTSPSTTYSESDMTLYKKTTFDVSGGTITITNIKRATLTISAPSSNENWILSVSGVSTHQTNIEIS